MRTLTTFAGVLCLFTFWPTVAHAQDRHGGPGAEPRSEVQKPREGIGALLERRLPEVRTDELPLDQMVEWLSAQASITIVVRWQNLEDAGVAREAPISLHARNLSLRKVLWLVLNEAAGSDLRLAYRADDDLILISTEDDIEREMVVRVYPIADLLRRVPDFAGPRIDIAAAGAGQAGASVFTAAGGATDQSAETAGPQAEVDDRPVSQRLRRVILRTVLPDEWAENGGRSTLEQFGDALIVRAPVRVHQALAGVLRGAN